jgi:hypothetical protein
MIDRWVRLRQITGLLLGFLGIFVLDLAFIGSSRTDLFYLPAALQTIATAPPTTAPPPQILGFNLLPSGNLPLYIIGSICLGIAMLDLFLGNRVSSKAPR